MTESEKKSGDAAVAEQSTSEQPVARFDTIKVYVKDVSFEAPSTPKIFTQADLKPKLDVQIGIDYRTIDEKAGISEIVLKATVTATHDDNAVYLAEVHQAGLFRIQHPDAETLQVVIEVACPGILLPFAREEINSLISKGGFNSYLLSPVNFEAIYRSKQESGGSGSETTETPAQTH